ncbi:hypothetical protein BGZ61DRAFT_509468 [Ilyonectria robusta]|uniref:uncharacterized protein n=1 Tax=Ilyonectria robusta TaxID=1079257 RepID=UPI001E8EAE94|nr:uncharacterized protein BGZ61DRAFT_509468 [Ilyonectria robusta]KAH8669437.1 hypothetical protein BGZ61DRAFT_509468 [Ilyonectria robusta]
MPSANSNSYMPPLLHSGLETVCEGLDDPWDNLRAIKFFTSLGRPVPKLPSAAEILDEAKKRGPEIFRNYRFLNTVLERHESMIWKRWAKKTTKQRLGILSKAWPDRPASYRPDFAAFRQKGRQWQAQGSKSTGCYMWPYINQEDLSQTQPLLLLLNVRGREVLSSFAAADLEAMHLGIVSDVIERPFLNSYTMILHGVTDGSEYGSLLFAPADGIVVLKAQDALMEFLVNCCQAILYDIPNDQLGSDVYPIQLEPPLKTEVESLGFESLAAMAAAAPYRVPAKFELEKVESLLAAKIQAAEDHLWALREDPHYFYQHLTRVIGNVLVEGYFQLETFSELHQQSKTLVDLQRKYAVDISPMKDLPREYLLALLRFRHFLNQAVKGSLAQLKQTVVVSPPMRRFYARLPPMDRTSSKMQIVSKGIKMSKIEENLNHLLRTLWEDDHDLFLFRLSNVVDELERLLEAEPAARDLISFHVAKIIGNLSIQSQSFHDANLGKTARFGEPLSGRFTYPIDKRRTKENVETLRRAERNLDVFWASVDRLLHAKLGKLQASAVQGLFSQARLLQRTPEWVEPLAGQNEDTATRPFFAVDNRALKVFRTLFFNPAVTSTPGELPWSHFVHAMTSVGFGAQKLYGSVWQFSPVMSDCLGSIHFHEPHPSGKLSFVVARRFSRRLTRAYGWTGEQFGLSK